MKRVVSFRGLTAALVLGVVGAAAIADEETAARLAPAPVTITRITPDQYRNIINDVFGPDIKLGGRFEPDIREGGLLAVGASKVSVTSSGLEQYDAIGRSVASQVVDESHRDTLIPCQPAAKDKPSDACAKEFLGKVGKMLFRRPLRDETLAAYVTAANLGAKDTHDFYEGLGLALASMLSSPQFLFRGEMEVKRGDAYQIDAFSKAARLSLFLWNTGPDAALLTAAERGDLDNPKKLQKHVDRMLTSPRVEAGVRAFFTDLLGFDEMETLSKDPVIYPKFSTHVAEAAQEQTLLTIVDHLMRRDGDYRALYTSGKTFLTPTLAAVYRVPLAGNVPNNEPDAWSPYEFPAGDPRAGLLSQISFLALHSHPGRSSPTLRGKALREILLCQKVPAPPGNVNFDAVQDINNPAFKTARQRLTAHATEAMCTGCHKITDPMGLALESFDSSGGFRTTENGAPIDTSGELNGVKFADAAGLGKAMHDSPQATSCLVNRLYSYAAGRAPNAYDNNEIKQLTRVFETEGYRLLPLMAAIATSDAFYRVSPVQTAAAEAVRKMASNADISSQEKQQ